MIITVESVCAALVDYVKSCVGLSAHPTNNPAAFGRAVAPFGSPAWVASLCAPTPPGAPNSTCEVFGVAAEQTVAFRLRILGHTEPLDAGGAVAQWAREVALAKAHGAYRTIERDGPPTVGALVHVEIGATPANPHGSRHWYRVIERRPGLTPDTYLYTTVDGGQNDRGYQAIAKCERVIRGTHELVNGVQGRPVVDWIDSPALLVSLASRGPVVPPAPPAPASAPADLPTLRRGSKGAAVARWQKVVGATADGDFGPGTEAKTRAWQAAHGLVVDGVVGPASWRAALAQHGQEPGAPAAPASPTPRASTARIECLDVADQQTAGWQIERVRAAGISVVWARATDGVDWIDPGFAGNVAQARRIGATPGGYHFLRVRHGRPQDGAEQGRQHVAAISAQGIDVASWVDCELGPKNDKRFAEHNAATREEWHVAIWETLEAIERASGIPPKIYTFVAHLKWLALPDRFTRWDLVIADYRVGATLPGAREGLAPWAPDGWLGWQYAAGPQGGGRVGTLDGVPIAIDRSVFRCSVEDLRVRPS